MQRRPPLLLAFALCRLLVSTTALSQHAATTDSVTVRQVEVIENADSVELHRSVADRTVISATQIRAKAPYQLQEVVCEIPGVFVRQYGGIGGMATLSVRGGSSAQSLVMLDGIRLNTVQTGAVDLSTIPISMISSVDVQRGALSAVNGSNAMTGSMNIRLTVPESNVKAQLSGGSFDSWKGAVQGAVHTADVAIGGGLELYGSSGGYEYLQTMQGQQIPLNRVNGAVRGATAMLRANGGIGSTFTLLARKTNRGVPGAIVPDVITQSRAEFAETDVLGIAGADVLRNESDRLRVDVSMRYMDQHYTDPEATVTGTNGIDSRFLARDAGAFATYSYLMPHASHTVKANVGFADLRGTMLQRDVGTTVNRRQLGIGYLFELNTPEFITTASARYEMYSDVGTALAGAVGLAWMYSETLTLRANIGTGFRPPSFSEMYFLNYGNSNLKSERSTMASLGTHYKMLSWLTVDASCFASVITNLIVSVPVSPVVTSAMNVGQASSLGFELGSTASMLNDKLSVVWNYTLQDVRDRTGRDGLDDTPIAYVPPEIIYSHVQWTEAEVMARVEWQYTSYRYAQAGGEPTSLLTPYHLINTVFGTTVYARSSRLVLQLRIDNILNERYAVVRGYPMPGTMVRLNAELSI